MRFLGNIFRDLIFLFLVRTNSVRTLQDERLFYCFLTMLWIYCFFGAHPTRQIGISSGRYHNHFPNQRHNNLPGHNHKSLMLPSPEPVSPTRV